MEVEHSCIERCMICVLYRVLAVSTLIEKTARHSMQLKAGTQKERLTRWSEADTLAMAFSVYESEGCVVVRLFNESADNFDCSYNEGVQRW